MLSTDPAASAALAALPEVRRRAFNRYRKLRSHLEQDVPLTRVAAEAGVPLRTANAVVYRTNCATSPKASHCKSLRSAPARSIAKCAALPRPGGKSRHVTTPSTTSFAPFASTDNSRADSEKAYRDAETVVLCTSNPK